MEQEFYVCIQVSFIPLIYVVKDRFFEGLVGKTLLCHFLINSHVLGIHNREDSNLTIDSSKPRVTGINSPAVHAWGESVNNARVNAAVTRKNSPMGRGVSGIKINCVPPIRYLYGSTVKVIHTFQPIAETL
ncbi:hypothetical protein PIB30_065554, partial [Stylosanthes scabra]|nr:hypothetical protein [Stylosanthes scabra]